MAVSVAALCGPQGCFALPACAQRLSADGCFGYLGGHLPLPKELNERARRLALAAVAALPAARGYLGVDMVLGRAVDGCEDYVIEINPRLTTSYIGLRAASRTNLAAAMFDVCRGRQPDLCFAGSPVEFDADGRVRIAGNANLSAR
jgi:predicted ATP-grasp superfamily ATP-dependent carboligase